MKISQIYEILNELSPFELQEEWDNSGLLVGSFEEDVKKVVLSIDIDEELIDSLEEGTLLITHHPIIFSGLKQFEFSKYPSNLLLKMIQKNISNIAMHTNFDKTHLNDFVAKEILKLKNIQQKSNFIIEGKVKKIKVLEFVKKIKKRFNLKKIKYTKTTKHIKQYL